MTDIPIANATDEWPLQLRLPQIVFYGPVADHDQACAVCHSRKAVYNLNTGLFEPCWQCQSNGWRLTQRWWKR